MHPGQRDWVLPACFLLLHSFLPAYLPVDMGNLCCGFQRCSSDFHKSIIEQKCFGVWNRAKMFWSSAVLHAAWSLLLFFFWQQRRTGTTRGRREDMRQRLRARLAGTRHASESSEAQKHHHMPQFEAWDAATAKSWGQRGFGFPLYGRSFYNTRPWCL